MKSEQNHLVHENSKNLIPRLNIKQNQRKPRKNQTKQTTSLLNLKHNRNPRSWTRRRWRTNKISRHKNINTNHSPPSNHRTSWSYTFKAWRARRSQQRLFFSIRKTSRWIWFPSESYGIRWEANWRIYRYRWTR